MTLDYKASDTSRSDAHISVTKTENSLAAQPTLLWHRIALGAILALAAFFTFFQINLNGYGNSYYAASVKSMMTSWHNFFFVSFDPGGFVSVDKPPLGLWIETFSAKIFGFSGFSLFLPQALSGLLCVLIIYVLVRRWFGPIAGLIAALVLALTPISLVMNRDNNQDMLLVLFLMLAAWCVILAAERGKLSWLLLCGVTLALAFNVKTLEAYLVVPAFGLLYLLSAPISWGKRILHLVLATLLMFVLSVSWLVAVDLTPASQRPYVGSSQDNSEISLALGYNGLQRLIGGIGGGGGNHRATDANTKTTTTQNTTSSPSSTVPAKDATGGGAPGGGGPAGGAFGGGPAGPLRLFGVDLGGQSGWFLSLALFSLLVLAWQTRLRLPLSRSHQALAIWGGWLLVTAVFFSVASFFHPYYLVIMAPPIAALSGISLVLLWQSYREGSITNWRTWMLPVGVLLAAAGQAYILTSFSNWTFLIPVILVLSVLASLILVLVKLSPRLRVSAAPLPKVAVSLALAALLVTPFIWSVISDLTPSNSTLPSAGPSATNNQFARPSGSAQGRSTSAPSGFPGGGGAPGGDRGSGINNKLLSYLETNQGTTKFLFATSSSMSADSYIIQTGKAVMAMGGFSGGDPILTTTSLAQLVKNNTIRYFLLSGGNGGGPGGFGQGSSLTTWVQNNCKVVPSSQWQTSTSTSGSSNFGFGGGGNNQLYDCATAR
jgi:4-amino-4-deoxy-L-arabinose transferase-like glycosyltransferase